MNGKQVAVRLIAAAGITAVGLGGVAAGMQENGKPVQSVAELGWIAGSWRTTLGTDQLEEIWGEPMGNQLAGAFRWIKDGKIWMNELITITDEGERIVFRLRHFSKDMVPWEEKDGAITLPLISAGEREAVFESSDPRHPMRFVYRRPSEDKLTVSIESTDKDKPSTKTFEFTRKK